MLKVRLFFKNMYTDDEINEFLENSNVEYVDMKITDDEVFLVYRKKENQELQKQQKEFIEWLEQKIKNYELPLTDENKKALGYTLPMKGIYKEVLEKYKELIGDKNE